MSTQIGAIVINWIPVLDSMLRGFSIGTGMVLAFVIWYGVINRAGAKSKKGGEE